MSGFDLGFGSKNQVIGDVMSRVMLEGIEQQEADLEVQSAKYDALLKDEDSLEVLRARRLETLKVQQRKKQEWALMGHGRYMELSDTKEFFAAAKTSERVICHFYRSATRYCENIDASLSKLALKHVESRFVKIDAEKSDFLVQKLGIVLMPTVVLVKDGKVVHQIQGFDELGGTPEFSTQLLAWVISTHGVLTYDGDMPEEYYKGKGVNSVNVSMLNGHYAGANNIREGANSYKAFGEGSDDEYD